MTELPWGEKWVARYKEKNGKESMGMANHHGALTPLVAAILRDGGTDIVITDETCRPVIIEGSMEIVDEGKPALEHLD